ncbi:MAG: 3-oxoacyl-[acyl-carrier-protein] reductase [Lachnospira sp.]|nr:3-oxoacyl-[acyl-carrier-protein] reductase [Lachnospira sp.]
MKKFENKIVLVTGAGRGIGASIAKRFASEGAEVIVNYSGNDEAAQKTVDEITATGGQAQKYKCSVNDSESVKVMIDEIIKKFGRIDILVNNAGITKDGLMLRMTDEDFDRVIDDNLKGTFNCTKYVSKYMLKQKSGKIINISSVVGLSGNAGQVNYSASKAGIIGITKSAAKELSSRGITVNAVAPGYVDTDMTKVLSDNIRNEILKNIPLQRMGNVEDISNCVAFLASEDASYITGQVISVDGGMHI